MALAEELRNSPDYGEALWDSVELYRRGHDFETSLAQVNQFIATRPRTLLPLAFGTFMNASAANAIGSALASMSIYILMAVLLVFRPTGLFGSN